MTITTTLEKTRKDIERSLSELDKTPLYAVVGAGDLAVEKLRAVRAELNARGDKLNDQATELNTKAAKLDATTLRAQAQDLVGDVLTGAFAAYGDLAGRGKSLVTRVENQQATADLQEQAKNTVARAKATTTTVKKQASATKSAAKATTTTAKKQASNTSSSAKATRTTAKKSAAKAKTSAKGTTTSARKTASAAKKATVAAAEKTGS